MQFDDDDVEAVEVGQPISHEGHEFGAATYDADHDGVAESVIIGQEDSAYVISDFDGDGESDSVTAYDAAGERMSPTAGDQGSDGDGRGDSDDGRGDDGRGDDGRGDDGADGDHDDEYGDGSAPDSGDDTTVGTGDGGDDGAQTVDAAGSISVLGQDGAPVNVGPPTVDMDGDGVPDTAVVKNDDGSTSGYTDRDGDGTADQVTQIGTDGVVVVAVADGNGGWDVVATGHVGPNGEFVEDKEPGSAAVQGGAAGETASSAPGIAFTSQDHTYDLGAPSTDMDGDGVADTVVQHLDGGIVVGYSDLDGDGQADQVTQIDPDGTVTIGVPDGKGGWEKAATGRLGDSGEFVPDPTETDATSV